VADVHEQHRRLGHGERIVPGAQCLLLLLLAGRRVVVLLVLVLDDDLVALALAVVQQAAPVLENILVDTLCFLKTLSDKYLNRAVVSRDHVPRHLAARRSRSSAGSRCRTVLPQPQDSHV
jgi:hypothetical protein